MAAKRRSAEEWRVIVAEWQASGRSKEEYARALGVSPITLGWWCWKLNGTCSQAAPEPAAPDFADVVLVEHDVERVDRAPDFVIELETMRVRVAPGFDGTELRRLLAALC